MNFPSNSRILITGATGFVGGRLAAYLAEMPEVAEVIATGRKAFKTEFLRHSKINFLSGELSDAAFVKQLFINQPQFVVHCAGLSSPWGSRKDFYEANVQSTKNILNESMASGIHRLVLISTPSVYFNFKDRFNISEDEPKKMVNPYAETKLEAEQMVLSSNGNGIETIALRPRAITGAGDNAILPRLLRAQREGTLKVIGKGNHVIDITSINNLIDAILLSMISSKNSLGRAYNITNGDPIRFWDLADHLFNQLHISYKKEKLPYFLVYTLATVLELKAKFTRKEPPITRYTAGIAAKSCTLNIEKAERMLNYRPKQSNLDAINEFVDWYKK